MAFQLNTVPTIKGIPRHRSSWSNTSFLCIDSGDCVGEYPVEAIGSEGNVSMESKGFTDFNPEIADKFSGIQVPKKVLCAIRIHSVCLCA